VTECTPAPSGRQPAGAGVHLSSFKGLLSVNGMDSLELKRRQALVDLQSQAAGLRRELASMAVKIEFYGHECSDGPAAYEAEMRPSIVKAEAALADVERLICELQAVPLQLSFGYGL